MTQFLAVHPGGKSRRMCWKMLTQSKGKKVLLRWAGQGSKVESHNSNVVRRHQGIRGSACNQVPLSLTPVRSCVRSVLVKYSNLRIGVTLRNDYFVDICCCQVLTDSEPVGSFGHWERKGEILFSAPRPIPHSEPLWYAPFCLGFLHLPLSSSYKCRHNPKFKSPYYAEKHR